MRPIAFFLLPASLLLLTPPVMAAVQGDRSATATPSVPATAAVPDAEPAEICQPRRERRRGLGLGGALRSARSSGLLGAVTGRSRGSGLIGSVASTAIDIGAAEADRASTADRTIAEARAGNSRTC